MCSTNSSRYREVSDLTLNYLCKLTGCTFNVQPTNLHNIFLCLKDHHESFKVTSIYFFDHMNNFLLSKAVGHPSLSGLVPKLFIHL